MAIRKFSALVGLLVALLTLAGCHQEYQSSAMVEIAKSIPEQDVVRFLNSVDSQLTIARVRNTDLTQIIAVDHNNGKAAADRANRAVEKLQEKFNSDGKSVKVWAKAEPAISPGWKSIFSR